MFWAKYPLECQQCVHNSSNTLHTCHALVLRSSDESRTSVTVGMPVQILNFAFSFEKNLIVFRQIEYAMAKLNVNKCCDDRRLQ